MTSVPAGKAGLLTRWLAPFLLLPGLSITLALSAPADRSDGIRGDEVAVIVNDADPASRAIADHYCTRCRIPAAHVCHIHTTSDEQIGRSTFERQVETPIAAWPKSRDLVERIQVLITTSGVLLKVEGGNP